MKFDTGILIYTAGATALTTAYDLGAKQSYSAILIKEGSMLLAGSLGAIATQRLLENSKVKQGPSLNSQGKSFLWAVNWLGGATLTTAAIATSRYALGFFI